MTRYLLLQGTCNTRSGAVQAGACGVGDWAVKSRGERGDREREREKEGK